MAEKIYSFIGLAKKAGRLVSGDETCERALKSGKLKLLITAEDASENTAGKFAGYCANKSVRRIVFGKKKELGRMLGREESAVIGITDSSFADRIAGMVDERNLEHGGEVDG